MAELLRSSQRRLPALHRVTADEGHEQSVPFRFRFHRESGPWDLSSRPLLLAIAHRISPRTSQRFPRTSKSDRFPRATRSSLGAFFPPPVCDRRCRYRSHTSVLLLLVRRAAGWIGSGGN